MQTQHESTRKAAQLLDVIEKQSPVSQNLVASLRVELSKLDSELTEFETTQTRHLSMIGADTAVALPEAYRACKMPPHEWDIMEYLYKVRSRPYATREAIMNWVYPGSEQPYPKIIDVFIWKLRVKMREHETYLRGLGMPCRIETIWGRGHRLVEGPAWPVATTGRRYETAA